MLLLDNRLKYLTPVFVFLSFTIHRTTLLRNMWRRAVSLQWMNLLRQVDRQSLVLAVDDRSVCNFVRILTANNRVRTSAHVNNAFVAVFGPPCVCKYSLYEMSRTRELVDRDFNALTTLPAHRMTYSTS